MSFNKCKFSKDRKYRYYLKHTWDKSLPAMTFIGLNPSTADEVQDDPTVRRCKNYAKDWGYGTLYMLNIFAYRATDPKDMKKQIDPIGKNNDYWLKRVTDSVNMNLCAWGNHGKYRNRESKVISLIDNKYCLELNKSGSPSHPLYLPKSLLPIPYK